MPSRPASARRPHEFKRGREIGGNIRRIYLGETSVQKAASRDGSLDCQRRCVLVVGGSGYVGSVLVRQLLQKGYKVRVLDRFLYRNSLALEGICDEPALSIVRGDLCRAEDRERALDGATDVVLLAALVGDPISRKYPELTRDVNETGARALAEACNRRGIRNFVFTSTCSNYGLRETAEPATEDSELKPLSIYAETKVAFERFLLDQRASFDFIPTILRISTAYGTSPRMRFDLTVNEFVYALASGQTLEVFDKDTWRPYCHVRDISEAISLVLEAKAEIVSGEVFNVGSDENNFTKAMIVGEIRKHIQCDERVRFVEGGSDPRNYRVSFRKISEKLGFRAQHPVAEYVPELIRCIQSGMYLRLDEIRDYYGNYKVAS
ncbi:MAG TPA: NAD-dependent epimerase/dehydratase family protein [Bryobacteraceae bacterium]|nr:NAD-dependent epimerase/dehydratase family protein [Bryobacteraceae bacterium]